ncbi:restriction endonuclease subunit S [Prevotella sp. E13-27]|uniref:restriction endonuclease subunit S n=1 Tax=Prevotella sp. E13-27 TaxID=2938122 RepID=UPI00200ACCB6|nr:restriction endonuclease subunit S [Prevotella sp. E13-27]MCK8620769.1 restriction endonuclease subunit S [Prevotella sp. E13-27]MCK8622449.1 restriction endonuclease subunit S [Prevotella sp. E13-27]MCK8622454.1 restriction endonuclease subunit S [Prevotella sp. E13-27]
MDTKKLRQKILDLAIRGKLVPQDPNDEPASVLLERIKAEKERLIKEGKIKRSKKSASDTSHYENLPFEIPESWVWTTIEEVTPSLQYGTSEKSKSSGDIAVLRMGNITRKGTIDYSDLVYTSNKADIEKLRLKAGDILFNRTNSSEWVGKTAIYRGEVPSIYAGYIIRMTPIFLDCEYVNMVMNSQYERDWCNFVKTDGVNQSNINSQKLGQFYIPIPPIEEQKRIVETGNYWLHLVESIESNKKDIINTITKAKQEVLRMAICGELVSQDPTDEPAIELLKRINSNIEIPCDNPHYPFDIPQSWCWIKLGALCSFLSRGKSPKYSEERKYPVFAQKCNLYNGDISLEQARFLDPSTLSKWDDIYKLREGDVLMNSTGTGTVGRTRVFHSDCLGTYPFAVPDSHVSVIRTFDSIESKYIHAYLSSKGTQRYLEDNLAGSTNQKELYIGVLDNLLIPLPPQNEQKRIVEEIDRYFNTLDKIKESLTA